MIKKHYSGSARRAENIIWNAAGRYDFDPPFLSFFPNGAPDHYFNMIIGFADKYIGIDRLTSFFLSYDRDRRRDEFDEYIWLGLENYLFEKECTDRPHLAFLRRERAQRFFKEQASLSRQQMEFQSMAVYTQQEIRWAGVLGRSLPLRTARDKKIADALSIPGTMDADAVLEALTRFLKDYFRFDPASPQPVSSNVSLLRKMLFRRRAESSDRMIVRAGTGEGDHSLAVQQRHDRNTLRKGPSEEDEQFIRQVFGSSAVTAKELRILENRLCSGPDADSRLWITAGGKADSQNSLRRKELSEIANLKHDIELQTKRNREYAAEHAASIRHTIRDLSTRIETVLSSYLRHIPEPSRAGSLRSDAAYRLPVLSDPRVFLKAGEETEPEVCVDLLLDASQSRMNSQEQIAAEAYIIAGSISKLHIPVRICAFRSLRNYTVLEILKGFSDRSAEGVFRYYAAGWNRDALALRMFGEYEEESMAGRERLMLVLTDASPNDTAPFAQEGLRMAREYEGAPAVKAAQEAVRALRNDSVRVGAVFHGNSSHLDDLHEIYGHSCVRIRKESQLAQGVSDLLLMMLREIRND